jgi:hypothetical protein
MQSLEKVELEIIERLKKQDEFLLRVFQAECAKDAGSLATESSRSNVIALRHTLKQLYGEIVAPDTANLGCGPR